VPESYVNPLSSARAPRVRRLVVVACRGGRARSVRVLFVMAEFAPPSAAPRSPGAHATGTCPCLIQVPHPEAAVLHIRGRSCPAYAHRDAVPRCGSVPWNQSPKPCLCLNSHLLRRSGAHGSGRHGERTVADPLLLSSLPHIMSWFNTCSEIKKRSPSPPSDPRTDVACHPAPAGPEGSRGGLALSVGDLGYVIVVASRVYERLICNLAAGNLC